MWCAQFDGTLSEVSEYTNFDVHDDQLPQVTTPVIPMDEGTELV